MRWLVERPSREFDDVGATDVRIESGALVFTTTEHEGEFLSSTSVEVIYAPGQWLTVVPNEDA